VLVEVVSPFGQQIAGVAVRQLVVAGPAPPAGGKGWRVLTGITIPEAGGLARSELQYPGRGAEPETVCYEILKRESSSVVSITSAIL
jgi:hypothetical protein